MKIEYSDPTSSKDEYSKSVESKIRERREEGRLIPLDLALLHSPSIAEGWNSFFGAIRGRTSLEVSITESIICRIAVLNHAKFEWNQHIPILMDQGKMSEESILLIKDSPPFSFESIFQSSEVKCEQKLQAERLLGERLMVVLAYTDDSTMNIRIKDEIFEAVKRHFNSREIVEITATIAGYNCVSRLLVALDVGECNKESNF